MTAYLGDLIPPESQTAKFQMILPKKWPNPKIKPIVIHLAGTGDHVSLPVYLMHSCLTSLLFAVQFFGRRRVLMAKPLLKETGIGSIILENPFCKPDIVVHRLFLTTCCSADGYRKPVDQKRSSLRNVSDIFVMGGCLILECIALFNWCKQNGYGPVGVTGISMGGHVS